MSTVLELSPRRVRYEEVRAFADWWEEMQGTPRWRYAYWMDAFAWWLEGRFPEGVGPLMLAEAVEELTWRELI